MNELERVTENLRSNEYCTYAQMNEAANMLEAMRDRIAELEKDAARYRWLKAEGEDAFTVRERSDLFNWELGSDLDAAIDAAMQKD